ncbi:MAG TPA: hypothetical protein VF045_10990 [Acidimicrobiales bacterium]
MIRKLIAATALAGSLVLLAAGTASADNKSINGLSLPGGNRVCLDSTLSYQSAQAGGFADRNNIKWTFYAKPYGTWTNQLLTEVDGPQFGVAVDRYSTFGLFPGFFRVCARNQGTQVATVSMWLNTY